MLGGLLALATGFFFACSAVLIRRAQVRRLEDGGVFITSLVNAALFAVLLALSGWRGALPRPTWPGLASFVLAGFLTTFLGRSCFFASIRHIGAARASSFKSSYPLVTVVVAVIFLGERLGGWQLAGMALVLGGIGLLSREAAGLQAQGALPPVAGGSGRPTPRERLPVGAFLGLSAAVIYGVGLVLRKVGLTGWPSPLAGGLVSSATGLVCVCAAQTVRGNLRRTIRENLRRENARYLLAALSMGMALLTSFEAYNIASASLVSVLAGTEPIMTTLLAAVFLRREERLRPHTAAAIGMAFLGSAALLAR